METFKYGKGLRNTSFTVTEEEEATVNERLGSFNTKKQAIEYLVRRGWSTKAIQSKIRYDDGRELLPQHINQVKQRMVR